MDTNKSFTKSAGVGEHLAKDEGLVRQVIGPTVDIEFDSDNLPNILNAIEVFDPERELPLVVEAAGATQVIVNGTTAVRSYDLASGEVLWYCGGQTVNAIPTAVTDGERVICASGYRGQACLALPLDRRGDRSRLQECQLGKARGPLDVGWSSEQRLDLAQGPVQELQVVPLEVVCQLRTNHYQ